MVRRAMAAAALAILAVLVWVPVAAADGPAVPVLDTVGYWRIFHTMKGPVAESDKGLTPLLCAGAGRSDNSGEVAVWDKIMLPESAVAPADWAKAEFDDSAWFRGPARRACRTPYLEHLYLRGKVTVTDPAKVSDLKLTLQYHGGVVVHLNGQEIARQNLTAGSALAEPYPAEAFVDAAGKLITIRGDEAMWRQKPAAEVAQRIAARERALTTTIPAAKLHQGVNVLAIEIVASPYGKAVAEQLQKATSYGNHAVNDLNWNTCEIRGVQLTAANAAGLIAAASRPAGFQVWNSNIVAVDYNLDFGDPSEKVAPIQLGGARNGIYSGKVVVGCDKPIRGLSASVDGFKGASGAIPAAAIRVRYGIPWGDPSQTNPDNYEVLPYPARPQALLALDDVAPKEAPVQTGAASSGSPQAAGQPATVPGAVVPVWVTVKIPADAAPGTYTGQLRLAAEGWAGTTVPVSIKVADWKLPDPNNWRAWVELIQSPDTLAVEYDVPLWSDKHWAMIERSFKLLGEVGCRVVYVPLIAHCNVGNAESMVRWVKKGDDKYDYDFSIMDKYLSLAEKHMGKPTIISLNVWDAYMPGTGKLIELKNGKTGTGLPIVTFVDAAGKSENGTLPTYADPAGKVIWKPFFDSLKAEMTKRGLEKAMTLGRISDVMPERDMILALKEITGEMPWISAGHYARPTIYDGAYMAKSLYQASYFSISFGFTKSLYGWKNPILWADYERMTGLDMHPISRWRVLEEQAVTSSVRGVGRLGADTWMAVRNKAGQRAAKVWERYPGSDFPGLNIEGSVLAPGADGPVATQRLEALREGTQDSEARIFLEDALTDKAKAAKLTPDFCKQVQQVLDERTLAMYRGMSVWQSGPQYNHEVTAWRPRPAVTGGTWFIGSGWEARSETLYTLAGEVQKKLGEK